jgi:hypothetical protein
VGDGADRSEAARLIPPLFISLHPHWRRCRWRFPLRRSARAASSPRRRA